MQISDPSYRSFYDKFLNEKGFTGVKNNMFMQYLNYHHTTMDEQQRLDMQHFRQSIKKKEKKAILTAPPEKDPNTLKQEVRIEVKIKPAGDCVISKDDIAIAYLQLKSAMTESQRNIEEPCEDKKKKVQRL